MWCHNCCLLFPLKTGMMSLAIFIALYNIAGAVFLFLRGYFFFFTTSEPEIYGGIGIAVAVVCAITLVGASNSSYGMTRLAFFLWPVILLVVLIRAALMIFQLNRHQDRIVWECEHGGQVWNATLAAEGNTSTVDLSGGTTIPGGFCSTGADNIYLAFVGSLAVDFALQAYQYFLTWRMEHEIINYSGLRQTDAGLYHV